MSWSVTLEEVAKGETFIHKRHLSINGTKRASSPLCTNGAHNRAWLQDTKLSDHDLTWHVCRKLSCFEKSFPLLPFRNKPSPFLKHHVRSTFFGDFSWFVWAVYALCPGRKVPSPLSDTGHCFGTGNISCSNLGGFVRLRMIWKPTLNLFFSLMLSFFLSFW